MNESKAGPFSLTVKQRIAWAGDAFDRLRIRFYEDEASSLLLKRLQKAINVSKKLSEQIGISEICHKCDRLEGGSCCGAGMENRYDGWLLLVNMLLQVNLPEERFDPSSCYFLGQNGCTLKARHVICINHVCGKITGAIKKEDLMLLREKEGEELEILFHLNERLKVLAEQWD